MTDSETKKNHSSGPPGHESLSTVRWQAWPWHPFLLSLLPLVIILSQNGGEIAPAQALRSAIVSLALTGTLLLGLSFIRMSPQQAALITSILIIFFHASGRLISGNISGPLRLILENAREPLRLALVLILLMVAIAAIIRLQRYHRPLTVLLNVAGLSLLISFIGTVGFTEWQIYQPREIEPLPEFVSKASPSRPPNIYYIVLDGYGRSDVLSELYGAKNTALADFLHANGFTVIEDARSNYIQTTLSLASSLNMDYLQSEMAIDGKSEIDRIRLLNLMRHNRVQQTLAAHRYRTVLLASGYRPSEIIPAAKTYGPGGLETNLFERLLIENSGLVFLQRIPGMPDSIVHPAYPLHRERIEHSLEILPDLDLDPQISHFVFAHILAPHPPFVFTAEGKARQPAYPYVLLDGNAFPGEAATYRRLYESQRAYLDQRLVHSLERLLEAGATNDVIIVQADHGPGSQLNWSSMEATNLRERLGILLAYRLPAGSQPIENPPRSPVNLFRAIINVYLGGDYRYLPDESYYSSWDHPYDFQHVPAEQLTIVD